MGEMNPYLDDAQTERLLMKERFGTLSDKGSAAIGRMRERGTFPAALSAMNEAAQEPYKNALRFLNVEPTPERIHKLERRWEGMKAMPGEAIGAVGEFATKDVPEWAAKPETQRMAVETAGGVVGGLVAPQIQGGRLAAQGLKGVINLASRMFVSGAGESVGSVASEQFDPSQDPTGRAYEAMGRGVVGEMGAGVLERGAKKIFGPSQYLREGGVEAAEWISERGGRLTPGLISDNYFTNLLENASEAAFFGGKGIRDVRAHATEVAKQSIDDFAGSFMKIANKTDVGDVVHNIISGKTEAFKVAASAKYKEVDRLMAAQYSDVMREAVKKSETVFDVDGKPMEIVTQAIDKKLVRGGVDLRKLKNTARDIMNANESGLGDATLRRITKRILEKDDVVSFADAQNLRSDLIGVGSTGTDLIKGKASGSAKHMAKALDKDMALSAKNMGDDALSAWRDANKFWKTGKAEFNSTFVKGIVKRDPDAVVDYILAIKHPGRIQGLKTMVGGHNTPAWKAVQGKFLEKFLGAASTKTHRVIGDEVGEEARIISGGALVNQLNKFNKSNLSALFSREERRNLSRAAEALAFSQGEVGRKLSGSLAIQAAQIGASRQAMESVLSLTMAIGRGATGILMTPVAVFRLFTSKTGSRLLTKGFRAPTGSKAASRAISQLLTYMTLSGDIDRNQEQEARRELGLKPTPPFAE